MSLTVWKFNVPVADEFALELPEGARALSVALQHHLPMVWFLVDPDKPTEQRLFHVRGTGHDASGLGQYIGTFLMLNDAYVGHLFEGAVTEERTNA